MFPIDSHSTSYSRSWKSTRTAPKSLLSWNYTYLCQLSWIPSSVWLILDDSPPLGMVQSQFTTGKSTKSRWKIRYSWFFLLDDRISITYGRFFELIHWKHQSCKCKRGGVGVYKCTSILVGTKLFVFTIQCRRKVHVGGVVVKLGTRVVRNSS